MKGRGRRDECGVWESERKVTERERQMGKIKEI